MSHSYLMVAAQGKSLDWRISLAVAAIPALASIMAAAIAARSARRAKKSEIDAQHLRDLEARISEKKYDVYKPMINLLKDILNQRAMSEDEFKNLISEFSAWVTIFGSDEAVRAFHNFMQATYVPNTPPVILMKLYAEFVISARRDMGYPETAIAAKHFLGMRISDLYSHDELAKVDMSLADLCREVGWTPPWEQAPAS
ncbi:hypothetical protein FNV62_23210 [Streptomyces sp. RLB3-17]|uniref:hypothetical protein n=1 Tax=Streptomyces sp. RLB3-17 TaxID=2594455 RepID=UPI0011641A66|nr:hypothetical protein [Streptomyces sp. RLB3-17]QDO40671.1 hypothetical protein FNV62_23210 [Streptomyces sp. RLB3-17]